MPITTVFTNNRAQAMRLPAGARLPEGVKKVQVRAQGMDRIISPVGHAWDAFSSTDRRRLTTSWPTAHRSRPLSAPVLGNESAIDRTFNHT